MCRPLILQKDFREFLRDDVRTGSVDLFLTDPPYVISRKTGFHQVKNGVDRFSVSMDFGTWDRKPVDLGFLCEGMYKALRKGGTAIVFYDLWKISDLANEMRQVGFNMLRLIIWQKTNPVPLNQSCTYLSNSREIAVVGVKGNKPTFHGKYDCGVYEMPIPRHEGKRIHPTQKPLRLFEQLIEKHSHAGDLVVDCFLGSGTAAIAAMETGRNFAGCEVAPHYFEKAKERIRRHDKAKNRKKVVKVN